MAPKVLKEFVLKCSIDSFVKSFWLDVNWYERFLSEKLLDISINVGEWTLSSDKPLTAYTRNVKSYHPSKISFPGLPSHAEVRESPSSLRMFTQKKSLFILFLAPSSNSFFLQSHKMQTYHIAENGNFVTLSIKETNSFRGIPYADYFTVNTEWIVVSSSKETRECTVKILLDFDFMKSTWLQGTIESNTRAELLTVYELWYGTAEEHILRENVPDIVLDSLAPFQAVSPRVGQYGFRDPETGDFRDETAVITARPSASRASLTVTTGPGSRSKDTEDSRSLCGSDDEMQFFDCEDERIWPVEGNDDDDYRRDNYDERDHLLPPVSTSRSRKAETPEKLRLQYSQSVPSAGGDVSSVKDLAVTVVETAFVLAEFSFWKVSSYL